MTFGVFPSQLTAAIQLGYLERAFHKPLYNNLAFRKIADKEVFEGRIGYTITKTRHGLMIPNTTPLDPATNTNLDNGLTAQQYGIEQYTLGVAQYPQLAADINLMDDEVTIASFAVINSENLGVAQATAVDRIARASLFNAYMGGNTVVTVTLGAPGTTVSVDDTRGFKTVVINGAVVPVSGGNPLPVFINNAPYNVVGFTNDVSNVSSALITGGTSGTITLSASVSVINGTAGNTVIGAFAPLILRPNGRTSTAGLLSSDLLTMKVIRSAVAQLRKNAIPRVRSEAGVAYNMYINADSMNELYADPEFQLLNRGVGTRDPAYERAWIYNEFQDVRFVETTETYIQPPQAGPVAVTQTVQRPIICGQGALIEGIFNKGLDAVRNMAKEEGIGDMKQFMGITNVLGEAFMYDGFYQYLRPPLDRIGQILSQASNYVGGFTAPTDVTTTSAIIPTASNAYYKRAIILETA